MRSDCFQLRPDPVCLKNAERADVALRESNSPGRHYRFEKGRKSKRSFDRARFGWLAKAL